MCTGLSERLLGQWPQLGVSFAKLAPHVRRSNRTWFRQSIQRSLSSLVSADSQFLEGEIYRQYVNPCLQDRYSIMSSSLYQVDGTAVTFQNLSSSEERQFSLN